MSSKEERYRVEVPGTLDLAERAGLSLNVLAGALDPEAGYEIYFVARLLSRPPHMYHDTTGLPTNNPKFAESFPMMRVMCGSDYGEEAEKGMLEMMVSNIGSDGLYYAPANKERRPWHEGVGHVYQVWNEDFANVYGNARMMLAMMALYQRDHDRAWLERTKKMAQGLARIAIYKDDYAYYPDSMVGEAFSYPKSGWKVTTEPPKEEWGAEGSTLMYHGGEIRALSRLYAMTGDRDALELARKLVNFVMKLSFWGVEAEPGNLVGYEHAHFTGHFHGHLSVLRGLLEYAIVANDPYLKEFARDGYEFARDFGIARIGLFGEGCATADMVALAIKLSDAGVGDYWEDVDQYVRNQLVEQQLVDADLMKKIAEAGPEHEVKPRQETSDRVIQRMLGASTGDYNNPTLLTNTWIMHCCTGNATQALYYAWEGIVRCKDDVPQVNLLLNRASPWLDVDSFLPYEGKVVIKNKTAQKIAVRIPRWVDKKKAQASTNGKAASTFWLGNYMVLDRTGKKDVITIEFPVVETTEKYTLPATWCGKEGAAEFTCRFKGNTLIDINPRGTEPGYPIYVREQYKKDKAPMKRVERYVSPITMEW